MEFLIHSLKFDGVRILIKFEEDLRGSNILVKNKEIFFNESFEL